MTSSRDLLHPEVLRWIHAQGWQGLRDVQERAIPGVLARDRDLVIAAATAAGKTEAAFLPIASRLLEAPAAGVQALCVSPLKALINDQHRRLDELSTGMGFPVHRWHGDVPQGRKRAVLDDPRGVLLITPESLEALFVLRGSALGSLFAGLEFVVIDELHAFPGSERGRQLQSLLHRLEVRLEARTIPRIGLSATLGDMDAARRFLRPEDPGRVDVLVAEGEARELRLQLRAASGLEATDEVVAQLYGTLRGGDHLVFANARRVVEDITSRLTDACERARVPNEFVAHHGSLSKELREEAEARLRSRSTPLTVIATSTLELGLDVGDVESVAQIGAPPSVASLRQRLGRSGRRGGPAVLRLYVRERELMPDSPPQDALREELVQAVAMLELLLAGWCEPPTEGALHLSTLVQQVLSVVAERSGERAMILYELLCKHGPFRETNTELFTDLLRAMGASDLVIQDANGDLLTGLAGEALVEHYSFYSAFETPEDWTVTAPGEVLGALPLKQPIAPGEGLVLAGRRWRVQRVDESRKRIEVVPGAAGEPPLFHGGSAPVHDVVRSRMRTVLESTDEPAYLSEAARGLLREARDAYRALGLDSRGIVRAGETLLVFPWAGDRVQSTLALQLAARGVEASADGLALAVRHQGEDELWSLLGDLEYEGPADPVDLARRAGGRAREKHDEHLDDELLARAAAARDLDTEGAHAAVARLLSGI